MERKYRQSGYMDSERSDDRSRSNPAPRKQLTKEERIQKRSLRHAMDREANEVLRCHVCGRGVFDLGTIGKTRLIEVVAFWLAFDRFEYGVANRFIRSAIA